MVCFSPSSWHKFSPRQACGRAGPRSQPEDGAASQLHSLAAAAGLGSLLLWCTQFPTPRWVTAGREMSRGKSGPLKKKSQEQTQMPQQPEECPSSVLKIASCSCAVLSSPCSCSAQFQTRRLTKPFYPFTRPCSLCSQLAGPAPNMPTIWPLPHNHLPLHILPLEKWL